MFRKNLTRALLHVIERVEPRAGITLVRRALEEFFRKTGDGYEEARAQLENLARAERQFARIAQQYVNDVEEGRVRNSKDADRYIKKLWDHYNHEIRPRRDRLIKLLKTA